MFHETTISLHSLRRRRITMAPLARNHSHFRPLNAADQTHLGFLFFLGGGGGLEGPGRGGRRRAPCHMLSTANGMALVHTWHFQRDGDAPRKRKRGGKKKSSRCLALGRALQPSPSVSQKALQQPTEPTRRREAERECREARASLRSRLRGEVNVTRRFFQVGKGDRKRKRGPWTRFEWQMKEARHFLLPVTLSLNLHPVSACQTQSQTVTLNMAVNSKSVAQLPSS